MTSPSQLTSLGPLLARPEAMPFPTGAVELRETHISWLLFAGDRVYKVKKPVRLSFLDYSTAERRLFFCREEVRLNSRLAAGIYRGVVPVTRMPSGRFRIGGPGEVVDHAVEMERLPDERMMDRLLARGEISNEPLDRLVTALVRFHAEAATGAGVDEHGEPATVEHAVLANLGECDAPEGVTRALERWLRHFVADHRSLLERRVTQGRIREGHGDLHAGNVCFLEDRVVAYDCIEFSPAFRSGDVASDLAFLVMDLAARGFPGFGAYLAHRYARAAGDADVEALVAFHSVHRALVRAKVAALRAKATADEAVRAEARAESDTYLALAAGRIARPALLVTCGLPGTGKSTIAAAVARALGAAVLASDVVRKRLAGMQPTEHWTGATGEGLYSPEWTSRTYEALLAETASLLRAGRSVVADATFPVAAWRARFADLARERGVEFRVVFVEAAEERVLERLERRATDATQVSDAGPEVYRKARQRFEPPDEVDARERVRLCDVATAEQGALKVVESLLDTEA